MTKALGPAAQMVRSTARAKKKKSKSSGFGGNRVQTFQEGQYSFKKEPNELSNIGPHGGVLVPDDSHDSTCEVVVKLSVPESWGEGKVTIQHNCEAAMNDVGLWDGALPGHTLRPSMPIHFKADGGELGSFWTIKAEFKYTVSCCW